MDSKAHTNSIEQLTGLLVSVAQSQDKSVLKLLTELMEEEIEDMELSEIADERYKEKRLNIKMPSGIKPYNIDYSESVIKKDIPALPAKVKLMIKKAIMERLTVDPIGLGKPLKHNLSGQRSLRVSTYRILYYIDVPEQTVVITSIEHRKDSYQS